MAQAIMADTKLRLVFETGMNEKGEPVYSSKTFSNIKITATETELFQAAKAVGSLAADPLVSIYRNDTYDLVE